MKRLLVLLLVGFVFLSLKPKEEYDISPNDYGLNYKELNIKTDDGLDIYGWLLLPERTSGTTVILSHDGDGNMQEVLEEAGQFLSLGYKVITYDYRGFGKSGDFEIKEKFYIYAQFQKDLDAVIEYARKSHNNKRIILYGKGIGAGLSLATGAKNRNINFIIADSPYKDLVSIQKKLQQVKSKEVMIPLAYDKSLIDPSFAMKDRYAKLKKYLIIYGKDDEVYDKSDMKDLYKLQKDNAELAEIKNADYNTTFTSDKIEYFKIIKEFLK